MARCCGGSGTCACKIQSGKNATVKGTGTSQDPFEISTDVALGVEDSRTFDLGLAGDGTLASPWQLRIAYADTASIHDLPDVDPTAPTNGQVLAWSNAAQKWIPAPPALALPGLISHDNSVTGDGSSGSPLGVRPDATRYITVTTSGVALNNAGINALVRVFPDAATRTAASPAPAVNTISILGTAPGQIDYYDGAAWQPINNGIGLDVQPGQMLALSGPYAGGRVTNYVAQVTATTDTGGQFELIPALDLTGYAGVLAVRVDPIGTTPWVSMLGTDVDRIICDAYRVDDGSAYASASVSCCVTALLYN